MLGSVLATLPIMAIFLIFLKQFVSGLLGGAVRDSALTDRSRT